MVNLETITHRVKEALKSILHRSDTESDNIIETDFEHEKHRDKLGKCLLSSIFQITIFTRKIKDEALIPNGHRIDRLQTTNYYIFQSAQIK